MENVDDLIGGEEQFETLEDLLGSIPQAIPEPLPASVTTNRAAILSALSEKGSNVVETFQALKSEAAVGDSTLADSIRNQATEMTREAAFRNGVLPYLQDPNVSLEDKQLAVNTFSESTKAPDSLMILAGEAIIADSEGENEEGSEARGSIDLFERLQTSIKEEQAIVNNFKRQLKDQSSLSGEAGFVAQEFLIPVAEGFKANALLRSLNEKLGRDTTFEGMGKAFLRPGATIEEIREKYLALDGPQRVVFVKALVDTIKETDGVIFSTDSQFSALATLEKVVGDYDSTEATFDSVMNALDIIGVGMVIRAGAKAVRGARKGTELTPEGVPTPNSENVLEAPYEAPKDIETKVANPEKAKLPALFAQKEELIASSSGVLPNRSVATLTEELAQLKEKENAIISSFKEQVRAIQIRKGLSRKQAEAEVRAGNNDQLADLTARKARIEGLLEQNRIGQQAQDKIKGIEAEIERISYLPDVDGKLRVNPIIDAVNRVDRNSLVGIENPASVGSIFFRTNPEKSRTALKLVFESEGDEVAQALFGTTRAEAIANAILPKQLTKSGIVGARPVDVAGKINNPDNSLLSEVKEVLADKGSVELTPREREIGASRIVNDFKSPVGIKAIDGMDGFEVDLDRGVVKISSSYGQIGGAFSTPENALQQAQIALRAYGDITPYAKILRRNGSNYEPVDLKEVAGQKGDFLIKIEFEKQIGLDDVVKNKGDLLEQFKVSGNWLDSLSFAVSERFGSLTRHILTAGAIFDKHITTAANVADALTSRLEKVLQRNMRNIAADMKRLPPQDRDTLSAYFVEANEKGIPLSYADLVKRGFTEEMAQIASDWRGFWDTIYYLENADLVKTLRTNGYQLLDNGKDRFFAKPIGKNIRQAKGYDPETGKVVVLNRQEMDELYEQGGTIAELRSPFDLEGEQVTNLIVKNKADNYLRGLNDQDKVLNYRDGYYQTSYKAPLFIDKIDPKTGKRVTIATAKDSREANHFINNKKKDEPDFQYVARPDKKDVAGQKEDIWDLNYQGGRTAQRRRGQPLVIAEGSNRLEGSAYFETPVESAIRASRSIAGRAVYRDVLATMKERAMQKHGHLFPSPEGYPKFPSKMSDIRDKHGNVDTKEVRDARTDFEYIHYLENGYINGTDSVFKTLMNFFARTAGGAATKLDSKALAATERGLRKVGDVGISGMGKAVVFNAYIATNILRQWIVQPAQVLRLAAYDPLGFPQTIRNLTEYTSFLATGKALTKRGQDFSEFLERSGILDSVDKSNLVRGTLMTSGEQSSLYQKTLGRVTEPMRVLGYDLGEKMNLIGHMSAVYNKYARDGYEVSKLSVRQEMLGKARALSYDMGFSGDMPYNQNFLAVFTQFMQVPHKAVMQAFDRRLTRAERARMVVGDMMIYGAMATPIIMAANALFGEEFLDENPQVKEFLTEGALQKVGNWVLQTALAENAPSRDLDLSGSLSPFEFGGWVKMAEAIVSDGGFAQAMTNTPLGGLLLKEGSRFQQAVDSIARLVGYAPDDDLNPETVLSSLNSLASVTSGWNNIQKAVLIQQTGKILTKSGQTLVNGLNTADAIAMAFGIPPAEISKYYEQAQYVSETKKSYEEAVVQAARTAIQVAVGRTKVGVDNPETVRIVNSILMSAYKNDPTAIAIINREMTYALQDPNLQFQNRLHEEMIKIFGEFDREKLKSMVPKEKFEAVDKWFNDMNASMEALQQED